MILARSLRRRPSPGPMPATINYNPVSYATPTDYLPHFTLTGGATLTQHMLVFPGGGDKIRRHDYRSAVIVEEQPGRRHPGRGRRQHEAAFDTPDVEADGASAPATALPVSTPRTSPYRLGAAPRLSAERPRPSTRCRSSSCRRSRWCRRWSCRRSKWCRQWSSCRTTVEGGAASGRRAARRVVPPLVVVPPEIIEAPATTVLTTDTPQLTLPPESLPVQNRLEPYGGRRASGCRPSRWLQCRKRCSRRHCRQCRHPRLCCRRRSRRFMFRRSVRANRTAINRERHW